MSGKSFGIQSRRGGLPAVLGAPPLLVLVVAVGITAVGTTAVGTTAASAAAPTTRRVSVGHEGQALGGRSNQAAISADGRFVAFASSASNLVPHDTNSETDIFVRDRKLKVTRRVSVGRDGTQGDGWSGYPSISADGRFVAFISSAENLVPGDENGRGDIFVHDRQRRVTRRVSVGYLGEADDDSRDPAISADGRYVAFTSEATNLVPGDSNAVTDVFVHDRGLKVTRRVSVGKDGGQGDGRSYEPAISADGRLVAFHSEATNLIAGDENARGDVFIHDRKRKVTRRVSVGREGEADGDSYEPALSADGRFVAFSSDAANLVLDDTNGLMDIFIRDRKLKVTRRVNVGLEGQADGTSYVPSISADGRFVTFESYAANLVRGDDNVEGDTFVRDRRLRTTRRLSVGSAGEGDGASQGADISADGRFAAFSSWAKNLVPGDTNATEDVFARGPLR